MKILKLTFSHEVNVSAQEGDILYFCNPTENESANNEIIKLGEIIDISRTPFIHSIAGKLSALISGPPSTSFISLYTVNQGVDEGMGIECIESGSTAIPAVLPQEVFSPGTTIATGVNHLGATGTTFTTSVAALDTVGGENYKFQLTTPGNTTLEVEMEDADYASYFSGGCAPCLTSASFLLFSKDNDANLSSMLGYYANVGFKNFSSSQVELFSVNTEVTQSSK
tara:strand:- start:50 stop:724 length:675 start_codon:yes stop_codon:yes gene_type:complete